MQPGTLSDWQQQAARFRPRAHAFIDGAQRAAASGETFRTVNPATGETTAEVASCGAADVDAAVRAARVAFEDGRWSRLAPAERKARILRLAALIDRKSVV